MLRYYSGAHDCQISGPLCRAVTLVVSADGQQRRLSVFPRQQQSRQHGTLGRFASRQRFMVNLIEEGRFHPAAGHPDVQREIKD